MSNKKKLKPSEIKRQTERENLQIRCQGCGTPIPDTGYCNACILKTQRKVRRQKRLNTHDIVTEEDDE